MCSVGIEPVEFSGQRGPQQAPPQRVRMPEEDHGPCKDVGACAKPDPGDRTEPRNQKRTHDDADADDVGDKPASESGLQTAGEGDVRDENEQAANCEQEQAFVDELDLNAPEGLAVRPMKQPQRHPADDDEGGRCDHRCVVHQPRGGQGVVRSEIGRPEMR
jgi:hypothetical protein